MDLKKDYPVFESNQILTSDHLNDLLDYLDVRDRYSRSKLIGVGIVCGFQLKFIPKGGVNLNNTLSISDGVGITTQGFLIPGLSCNAHYYRKYTLPETVSYGPFIDITSDKQEQDIDLYELISTPQEDASDLTKGFLEGTIDGEVNTRKVVLLFLEIFDQDLETCLAKSCDEVGKKRLFELRRLLISVSDLEKVLKRTNENDFDPSYPNKFPQNEITVPRVNFKPNDYLLATDYTKLLDKYSLANSETLGKLITAIEDTYEVYKPILETLYDEEYIDALNKITELKNTAPSSDTYALQYVYDFVKDLTLAYNEFNSAAFELSVACNFNKDIFPQHLMLGPAIPQKGYNVDSTRYYNRFIISPAYIGQKHLLERTRMLHKRLVSMILSFNLDYIDISKISKKKTHIVPSHEKLSKISQRSIPFYYDINNAELPISKLWNYNIEKRKLSDNILSYHRIANENDPVKSPIRFDLDKYSFLRIERIPGKEIGELKVLLKDMINNYNLPFNVVTLSLFATEASLEIDAGLWKDLQESYSIYRDKLLCNIKNLPDYIEEIKAQNILLEYPGFDIINCGNMCDNLTLTLPGTIEEFDFDYFFTLYCSLLKELHKIKLALKHFRGKLIHVLINVTTPEDLNDKLIKVEEGLDIIQKTLDNCSYKELYLLYYRLIGRKKYLVENHPSVFSNFLRKHPGMEHAGGVKKGGTLILVCGEYNAEGIHKLVFADFSLPYRCCCEQVEQPDMEVELSYSEIPDLALPDGAIAVNDTPVKIDILQNDYIRNVQDTYVLTDSPNAIYSGIERIVNYTPNTGSIGFEEFNYTLNRVIEPVDEDGNPIGIKVEIIPETIWADAYFGYSVDIYEKTVIVGAIGGRKGTVKTGCAYIYEHNNGQWKIKGKLTPGNGSSNDQFGYSVSIYADYAVVGAFGEDTGGSMAGSVYVFKKEGESWEQKQKIQPEESNAGDFFGSSLTLIEDTLVIGSFGKDGAQKNEGCVYIFKREDENWIETQILKADDAAESDYFGYSVAMDQNNLLVGAYCKDLNGANSGCAYVFGLEGDTFSQKQIITASDIQEGDYFGRSVAIHKNHIVVGAQREDSAGSNSGSAYVFKFSGDEWIQQKKLIPADSEAGDYFGYSVDIFDKHIIVGARYEDSQGENVGSAYLFERSGSSWTETNKLQPVLINLGDLFGSSVAINKDILVIGAHKDDQAKNNVGKVYILPKDFEVLSSNAIVTVLVRDKYSPHILAKDDLQIVPQNESIEINVIDNDVAYDTTVVQLLETTSELGGTLVLTGGEIKYTPKLSGKDSFKYKLLDPVRGEESIGNVTVFVTKHEETLPDIVYLVTSPGVNIIPIEIAQQADWKIISTDFVNSENGTLEIGSNAENLHFTPGSNFQNLNTLGFNYIVEGPGGEHLVGRVSLINGLKDDDYQGYIDDMLVGTILTFAYDPTSIEFAEWMKKMGILECNGQMLPIDKYKRLFKRIGTIYGSGDGKTTFNLPDLRGEFIRGWSHGEKVDLNREFGSKQLDSLQAHTHADRGHTHIDKGHAHQEKGSAFPEFSGPTHDAPIINGQIIDHEDPEHIFYTKSAKAIILSGNAVLGDPVDSKSKVGAGVPRLAKETRPRNVALMFCIKY